MADTNRLAKRLLALRIKASLPIENVAREMKLEPAVIAAFESGAARPTSVQIDELATLYGVTVYRFISDSIPQSRDGKLVVPEQHALNYGIGRNIEEARVAKNVKKTEGLPYFDIDVPDDLTIEELEALAFEMSSRIGNAAILLNSTLRGITNDVRSESTIRSMRLAIRDILEARMIIDNSF